MDHFSLLIHKNNWFSQDFICVNNKWCEIEGGYKHHHFVNRLYLRPNSRHVLYSTPVFGQFFVLGPILCKKLVAKKKIEKPRGAKGIVFNMYTARRGNFTPRFFSRLIMGSLVTCSPKYVIDNYSSRLHASVCIIITT